MKNLKSAMVVTALILPISFSGSVLADMHKKHGDRHHEKHHEKHRVISKKALSKLDLSREQKAEIKALKESHREQQKAKRDEMKVSRGQAMEEMEAYKQQMGGLILSGNFDESQVRALAKQMVEKHSERKVEQMVREAAFQNQVAQILTADQREALKKIQKQHAEKRQERMK